MAIIWFIFIIFPCHCAVYMYKITILQKPLSQFPPNFTLILLLKFRNHLAEFHQISHWSFCWNVFDSLFKWSCSIDCQAHIFFFKTKNCSNDDIFISCDDRTGKMLHNICMSAVAMSLRWANCGPWASCFFYLLCFSFTLFWYCLICFLSAQWRLIGLGRYPCWSNFPGCPYSQFVGFVKGWLIWWKTSKTRRPFTFEHNGTVAQLLECPFASGRLWVQSPAKSYDGLEKWYKLLLRLHSALGKQNWLIWCQYNVDQVEGQVMCLHGVWYFSEIVP